MSPRRCGIEADKERDSEMEQYKVCLNCGCSIVRQKEENCPVCNKPVKNAEPLKSPFGEKQADVPVEVKNEDNHTTPTGQGDSPANI